MGFECAAAPNEYYLVHDLVTDFNHPLIQELAHALEKDAAADIEYAVAAFEFVRDEIRHSADAGDARVTISASEVLAEGTGLCFGKSHLLAALLRHHGIAAGFCYQRINFGDGFSVHGLVAANLESSWHRLDARGNNSTVHAEFSLDQEKISWNVRPDSGECDYQVLYPTPHPQILHALHGHTDVNRLVETGLPSVLEV